MPVPFEEYLRHYQAAHKALATKRLAEARRELLLAGKVVLGIAEQTPEGPLREDRKRKGLRMLELARKIPSKPGAARSRDTAKDQAVQADEQTAGASTDRWQVIEKPGIRFGDIAGLDEVKDLIRRRVLLPFRNPELAETYRRKPGGGILMYGPPGTGKTMMAKAIATELDAAFYNVQCSDIMSKWVGEAEANLKELFDTARSREAAVLFFDETEALIGKRGGSSTVMNRLIPEFLAQIDGLKSKRGGMLLLGATNRPWDLDPAAMRHGRFGEQVYVGLPDVPARRFILQSTLGTIPCESEINLDALAARTEGFSGADLHGLVDRIIDPAFEEAMESGRPVPVRPADVERALANARPSVSERDLKRYERFRSEGE